MTKLIDAACAEAIVKKLITSECTPFDKQEALDNLHSIPVADAQKVKYDYQVDYPYCPHCGAKMHTKPSFISHQGQKKSLYTVRELLNKFQFDFRFIEIIDEKNDIDVGEFFSIGKYDEYDKDRYNNLIKRFGEREVVDWNCDSFYGKIVIEIGE